MAAARRRPELDSNSLSTTFLPLVPQAYVDVDRDKAMKQGVDIGEVYQTLQAYLGGTFVNYFNRFGRQWQVYVEAEAPYRSRPEGPELVLRAQPGRPAGAALDFGQHQNAIRPGIHAALQPVSQRPKSTATPPPATVRGRPISALEEVFAQTMGPEMGYDYMGMSFQEKQAQKGVKPAAVFGLSLLFVFLILAALYESWSCPSACCWARPSPCSEPSPP